MGLPFAANRILQCPPGENCRDSSAKYLVWIWILVLLALTLAVSPCGGQQTASAEPPKPQTLGKQINVNWFYGSYVPKDVPLRPLNGGERFKLYIHQTYITPGIYAKTTLFAVRDQIADTNPEWGSDSEGFAKRLGNRQAQFILQNSISSLGQAALGWEPRYDRCRCEGFWARTRHAVVRNFVTYNETEKSLRPQVMPYLGAFGASAIASTWEPGNPVWQVKGYQAAVTQIFVGAGINWVSEFAPEIGRIFHKDRKSAGGP